MLGGMVAADSLLRVFESAPRVVVAGGPKTGKTTLAIRGGRRTGKPTRHSDALVTTHKWGDDSAEVATWFDQPGEWIVEGATMARALRKWLAGHPGQRLDVTVIYCRDPLCSRSKGQETMAKGVHTVWTGVLAELRSRGVTVVERD